ncbi:hypothetical protein [Amycolatopsis thermoflava]|uniref:hypothetical protein n=1 Tax=Amycolatopsis thermoflava TaxID=84480 RepID=UPI003661F5B3
MAIVVEAASVVLTVAQFRWAFAAIGGTFYDVVGGFVWPIALHAVAIVSSVMFRRVHEHRARRLFTVIVVTIAVFAGLGAWQHSGFDLLGITLAAFVSIAGPITVRMAVLSRPPIKTGPAAPGE